MGSSIDHVRFPSPGCAAGRPARDASLITLLSGLHKPLRRTEQLFMADDKVQK
jgi:hypothetical protein